MTRSTILLAFGLLIIVSIATSAEIFAQGKSKSNGPPPWAPAHGYRAKVKHVYFPEHNFYYDVAKGVYIYVRGDNWEISAKLPPIFAGVDLSVARKVELNINTSEPQQYNSSHLEKYALNTTEKEKNSKDKSKGKGKGKR